MRQLKISKSITNRESESLEKYLQEIGKVDMISAEEEVQLAELIKLGDQKALDKLTKANLRFVVSVAKQYQNQGLTLPDLINEGNLGLIKAAQRFDETRGFKFISYAVWWIRQSIMQALAENARIVRLPLNKVGLTAKLTRAHAQLEQELERPPTVDELAQFLGVEPEEITAMQNVTSRHVSMDSPLGEDDDNTLIDIMENKNADSANKKMEFSDSLNYEIERALSVLTPRQREVICLLYGIGGGDPVCMEELASRYGLTRERVRQIKDKALEKLRAVSEQTPLREFMGK
ncbi:MAG TPA: RNA polymerase sigma factor RpoD/SigA [Ginsengibacter sp.]|nr:RNA polymerase sigma factor RpoD/SigA [Chitinophagaceae bacterium]HRN71875.1 RNA polymerase sigma factor RpoD/SigA [Ginsengibacter sp.]HRP17103.1 RNA polymerase sigma factor RpoD/SigA [Ginsengibacter sp.]